MSTLPPLSEKAFQAQVVQLAKTLGWRVQFHWQERHSPAGWPDLTLWRTPRDGRPGRVLLAELKSAKGKLSPAQAQTIGELRDCGLDVRVWRPDDFDSIAATLGGDCGSGDGRD